MKPRFHFCTSQLRELRGYETLDLPDFQVFYPSTIQLPQNNSIFFFKKIPPEFNGLRDIHECILIVPKDELLFFKEFCRDNIIIPAVNPRLEFARLLSFIVSQKRDDSREYRYLPNGSVIGENVILGDGVKIEPLSFIDHDVSIGDYTTISTGVKIRKYVDIGSNTLIRENAVIGGMGFGFERDETGHPIRIPHLGGVNIGSHVEIGSLNTVVSGTINPTIIENYVKTDDHVHIAHNCIVRKGSLLTACSELSGGVEIGEYSWIGPNSSIMQSIKIGANSCLGIGTVLLKSIGPNTTVAGNPAELTSKIKLMNKAKEKLLEAMEKGTI